jgi:hypothetical protein
MAKQPQSRPTFFQPGSATPKRTPITKNAQGRELQKQTDLVGKLSEARGQSQKPLRAVEIVTTQPAPIAPPPQK